MSKHGSVTHQLVQNVRLRRVKRLCMVSNILRRVENLESEAIQELTLGQETTDWLQSPTSSSSE